VDVNPRRLDLAPRLRDHPRVVELTAFADGVWLTHAPVRMLGMRLTSLLVHSPIAPTPELRAAVDALGTVAHVYAPNLFHHLRVGEWSAAYPQVRVHAPPGLAKKRPDLRIDRVHPTTTEPAFAGVVDEVHIDGFRLQETVLLHRPSKTLVVADLVHNLGRPDHWWTAMYSKMMGFYDRVALSRAIRSTAFSDRAAARRSVDEVLALPFERVVLGHGAPLESGARDAIAAAYGWLPRIAAPPG
jgi:hypothetical protein